MIKFVKACNVCKQIKKDENLGKRIYESRQYIPGGEPLTAIAEDYKGTFSYQGLYNHATKHQNPDEGQLIDMRLRKTADQVVEVRERRRVRHDEFSQAVIDKAMEMMENGELKGMTLSAALKAAQMKQSAEEKQADRQQAFMAMIAKFASGEMKRIPDEEGYRLGSGTE